MAKNTKAKGAAHEKAVRDHLERNGWEVESRFKKTAWVRGRPIPIVYDLFRAFDIVAIRNGYEVKWIQVTAGGGVAARRRLAFDKWGTAEVWEHLRAGVYRVHYQGGATTVVDVRASGQAAGEAALLPSLALRPSPRRRSRSTPPASPPAP